MIDRLNRSSNTTKCRQIVREKRTQLAMRAAMPLSAYGRHLMYVLFQFVRTIHIIKVRTLCIFQIHLSSN